MDEIRVFYIFTVPILVVRHSIVILLSYFVNLYHILFLVQWLLIAITAGIGVLIHITISYLHNHHHHHHHVLQGLWRRVAWRVWVSSTWWVRTCGRWCCVGLLCPAEYSPTVPRPSATPGPSSTPAPPPSTPWWTQREDLTSFCLRTADTCYFVSLHLSLFHSVSAVIASFVLYCLALLRVWFSLIALKLNFLRLFLEV